MEIQLYIYIYIFVIYKCVYIYMCTSVALPSPKEIKAAVQGQRKSTICREIHASLRGSPKSAVRSGNSRRRPRLSQVRRPWGNPCRSPRLSQARHQQGNYPLSFQWQAHRQSLWQARRRFMTQACRSRLPAGQRQSLVSTMRQLQSPHLDSALQGPLHPQENFGQDHGPPWPPESPDTPWSPDWRPPLRQSSTGLQEAHPPPR